MRENHFFRQRKGKYMDEKQRILIVEDDASIAELEKDYLELSGFSVDMEKDGEKGLQKALNTDYDLLI